MRIVFDFAVWSKGDNAKPVLIVCEEAHRYVPTDKNTIFSSTKHAIDRIAREGRKYGVSLGLVSQRPADLSEASLSQCGTFFVMRMNNEKDKRFVENVLPEGSVAMVDSLSALANGEALVVGEGVTAPVKIKMDLLRAEQRPRSSNPHFSSAWLTDIESNLFIDETISNWRMHGR
jgi:DNA helicase HerA-like ATPase